MKMYESKDGVREGDIWISRQGIEWIVEYISEDPFDGTLKVGMHRIKPTHNKNRDNRLINLDNLKKYYKKERNIHIV